MKNKTMNHIWGNRRRFHSYADYCRQKYGTRLQKVSINAGFTCPNRDGTTSIGGCSFCNNQGFSPSYCHDDLSITHQIDKGVAFIKNRYRKAKVFIAYFQSYSNTYAPHDILRKRYAEALNHPEISGISIGTRPDCVNDDILDMIADLGERHIVSVEYGVESCYNETLKIVNRGHTFEESVKAIKQTAARGIHTGIHIIIGLPGESADMMIKQSDIISRLPVNSVKFHQLQIVKGTPMAQEYENNPENFHFFEPDEYVRFIAGFLERLHPRISTERLAGEVPPAWNLRPGWRGIRSDQVIGMVEQELAKRDSWQGKFCKHF